MNIDRKRSLNDQQVIDIFRLENEGKSVREIEEALEIPKNVIYNVLNYLGYKDVIEKYNLKRKSPRNRVGRPKGVAAKGLLPDETIIGIYGCRNEGLTIQYISEISGVAQTTVAQILNGQIYKNIIKKYGLKVDDNVIVDRKERLKDDGTSYRGFSDNEIIDMFNMRNDRKTLQNIADKYDITREMVRQIFLGTSYGDIIKKHDLKINSDIKDEEIIEIVNMYNEGIEYKEISEKVKLSIVKIKRIINNKEFKDKLQELGLVVVHPERNRTFSSDDIQKIFNLRSEGKSQVIIAEIMDTAYSYIGQILQGKVYKDVIEKLGLIPEETKKRKLNDDDLIEIFKMRNNGLTLKEVSRKFEISSTTVELIEHKRLYRKDIERLGLEINKEVASSRKQNSANGTRKKFLDKAIKIKQLLSDPNNSGAEIERKTGAGYTLIQSVKRGDYDDLISEKFASKIHIVAEVQQYGNTKANKFEYDIDRERFQKVKKRMNVSNKQAARWFVRNYFTGESIKIQNISVEML